MKGEKSEESEESDREYSNCFFFHFLKFFGFVFVFSRATPVAYRGSQARGRIGAAAADLRCSSWQRRILNPLSKAGDRIHNLMVPSRIRSSLRHDGSSSFVNVLLKYSGSTRLWWVRLHSTVIDSYTLGHPFSSDTFPTSIITDYWAEFPVLYSRSLLASHS